MVARLAPTLSSLLDEHEPDLVLGPFCLGDHVDHHIVREALLRVVGSRSLLLWEDWPYADRVSAVPAAPAMVVSLDDHGRAARLAACLCYRTQLAFQFGGAESLRQRMRGIGVERFHAVVRSADQ